MAVIAVVVLGVAGGIAYWSNISVPQEEPASLERMAFPLPDKPSIAVLPLMDECQIPGVDTKRTLLTFQIRSVASRVRWQLSRLQPALT